MKWVDPVKKEKFKLKPVILAAICEEWVVDENMTLKTLSSRFGLSVSKLNTCLRANFRLKLKEHNWIPAPQMHPGTDVINTSFGGHAPYNNNFETLTRYFYLSHVPIDGSGPPDYGTAFLRCTFCHVVWREGETTCIHATKRFRAIADALLGNGFDEPDPLLLPKHLSPHEATFFREDLIALKNQFSRKVEIIDKHLNAAPMARAS